MPDHTERPESGPDDATAESAGVRRSVEIEADPSEVWQAVIDDDERAEWFGGATELTPVEGSDASFTDADGSRREATIDVIVPGRRLAWTWLDDDGSAAGAVTIDVTPSPSGTRVDVVETRQIAQHVPVASARTTGDGAHDPVFELEHLFILRAARRLAVVA